jgi:hypothetical protein
MSGKTFTAAFAQTNVVGVAEATLASVITTSTPTNTVLIVTAGAEGALLTKLSAVPRATVAATALYAFISKDGGATKMFIDSELMGAYTMSATTATPKTTFKDISEATPIRLAAGDKVYVGIGVALASGIVFTAQTTDF